MLLPTSMMMKFFAFTSIVVLLLIQPKDVFANQEGGDSIFGLLQKKGKPLPSKCGPNSVQTCYLEEAFYYIVFGPPNPNKNTTLYEDIIANLDQIPDNVDLNFMLLVGLQQLTQLIDEADRPADWDFVIQDIVNIISILETQGSSAVTWYRLKYHIIRFITPANLIKIGRKLLQSNGGGGGAGVLLNNFRLYINNIFLANIGNDDCRASLSLWFDALTKPTQNFWALRMFDATGKPPTNLFAANTNWMGNWNSCHRVKYKGGTFDFRGRYCRAKVRADPSLLALAGSALDGFPGNPDELAAIDIGICVPDLCYAEDLAVVVNNTLKLLTIHYLAYINETNGVICEGPAKPSAAYYFTIVIITILTVLVVIATFYDCIYRIFLVKPFAMASSLSLQNVYSLCNFSSSKPIPHGIYYKHLEAYQYQYSNRLRLHGMTYPSETERKAALAARKSWYNQIIFRIHRIVIELSAYTAILKPMSSTGAMKCLNGMRVISMIWIIWGHTYNYLGDQSYFLLIQNALDLLELPKERIDPQLIINALFGVDTFFLISATLVTLSLLRLLQKSGMPNWYFWPMMYLERYLRLIPPYILIFLLYIFVVPYIGQGPLWTANNFPMKNSDCHNYWWAYFLLINNFVPNGKGTRCLGYYWYVSNDFQLFLIAPLLIVPLFYSLPVGAFILGGVLIASSCILGFNIANTYREGQILVTLQAIWEDTYIKPYCRAGPYIIGIVLGYILFRTDKKKIYLHPLIQVGAWLLSAGFMLICILLNFQNHGNGLTPMPVGSYTVYFVLARIAWPLAIAWIIFASYKGMAPLVDSILSWRGFTFFAHMSYTTYLIHPMIMVYYMFAQQSLFYATDITLIYIFLGHLIISLVMGFLTHAIFERPFGVLFNLILPKRQR